MPNRPVTKLEFAQLIREMEVRMYPKPEPIVEAPHEVEIVETPPPDPGLHIDPVDPDEVYGYPELDDEYEEPEFKFVERIEPQLFPGQSLNPDDNIIEDNFTSALGPSFGIVRGKEPDPEEVEKLLGDSYGAGD